jgi:murein DD-endopeptidase MepM/ murein hydrolase activator NlpD
MGIEIEVLVPERGTDSWGSGHFGADRGKRVHVGIDFCAPAGGILLSPVSGHVTKHGYPYGDDLTYRYVQVRDNDGLAHRFFYVEPIGELGRSVTAGTPLGTVQDIVRRYSVPRGMKNHFHYEIKDQNGNKVNPEHVWQS